jgi:transcriptional regulator with XRE-family HTH domain
MIDTLGRVLKAHRKKAGFSQKTLALKLHQDDTYVSKVENERITPSWEYITKFCALGALQLSEAEQQNIQDLYQQRLASGLPSAPSTETASVHVELPIAPTPEPHPFHSPPSLRRFATRWIIGLGGTLLLSTFIILLVRSRLLAPEPGKPLDVSSYCQDEGYTSALSVESNPYGWHCVHADGTLVLVDLNKACMQQHGEAAPIALLSNIADPQSWVCSASQMVDFQNGWCGAVPVEVGRVGPEDHAPRMFYGVETPLGEMNLTEYFVYFEGEYVGPDVVTLRTRNMERNQWEFAINEEWTTPPENAARTTTTAWRIDYKCAE